MGRPNQNVFSVGRMASGRLYLELTANVGWEGFPDYAEVWLARWSGEVVSRHDSVDVRVWKVLIGGQPMQLVYDDFPVMISLESQSVAGDKLIEALAAVGREQK